MDEIHAWDEPDFSHHVSGSGYHYLIQIGDSPSVSLNGKTYCRVISTMISAALEEAFPPAANFCFKKL